MSSSFLDHILGLIDKPYTYTSDMKEIKMDCPICGETRKRFFIGTANNLCYCHNCNYSGTLIKLSAELQGISYSQAVKTFKDHNGVLRINQSVRDEIYERLTLQGLSLEFERAKTPIPLPPEFTNLEGATSEYSDKVREYLRSRGVTPSQIRDHGIGYCRTGDYQDRAILPIYENGEIQFWVGRAIYKSARMKEMSPHNADNQISKSEVLFNVDRAVEKFGAVVLAEGIYDAMSFGDIGVGLLGKRMSQEQFNKLLGYKPRITNGVYLALDEDAFSDSLEMAEKLSQHFSQVYIIRVEGDPNEHLLKNGKRSMAELIKNATRYSKISKLRMKLDKR